MSQIGDFMIVLTPRRQLFGAARTLFEFSEFADDASASWVRMPSASGADVVKWSRPKFRRRHPRKRMTQYAVPFAIILTPAITGYPLSRV
jgi:hypothetical protein